MGVKYIYVFFVFWVGFVFLHGNAILEEDKQALLGFVNNFPHSRNLNWVEGFSVCDHWTGVICSEDGSRVIAVRLPGVGFHGPIPANTLGRLTALQTLSLRSNGITGSFPSDFFNLSNLSYLYLQFNDFSGPLPSYFSAWKNLTVLNLSNNRFNGSIPSSISNLTQLEVLNLSYNSISGEIPDFNLPNLKILNLSNNQLSGIVPKSLQKFPSSAFGGNNVSFPNSPPVTPKNVKRLSQTALLGIIIGGCVIVLILFGLLMFICLVRRQRDNVLSGKLEKGEMSPEKVISRSQDANNKLFFFESCTYVFDLEDLLRASAEVLGKGTFGTAYRAILEDANMVVVKRLKKVSAGKREFEQQMEVVGSIKHENVTELRAYFYSKDEKLMVYDYYSQGSVAAMVHGKRGEDKTPLDWETRMRIVIGAARGIARVHEENGGKLVHGNVKSSNIFLNPQQYGCVSDVGLSAIMSPLASPATRAAGYRAPEVTDTRKSSQSSDVYSFGVLLLEMLTGKSPIHATGSDEIVDLVRWVQSVVREEWTAEVFDLELMRFPNMEEEMVEMLQIALACVARIPDQRPKMGDVLRMVENVKQSESGDNNNGGPSEPKSENATPPADISLSQ